MTRWLRQGTTAFKGSAAMSFSKQGQALVHGHHRRDRAHSSERLTNKSLMIYFPQPVLCAKPIQTKAEGERLGGRSCKRACCDCKDPVTFSPSFSGVLRIGGSAGQEATFQASRGTLDSRGPVRRERVMPKESKSGPKKTVVIKGKGRMEGRPYEKSPNGISAGVAAALVSQGAL
jgi:hypothetical protein